MDAGVSNTQSVSVEKINHKLPALVIHNEIRTQPEHFKTKVPATPMDSLSVLGRAPPSLFCCRIKLKKSKSICIRY